MTPGLLYRALTGPPQPNPKLDIGTMQFAGVVYRARTQVRVLSAGGLYGVPVKPLTSINELIYGR